MTSGKVSCLVDSTTMNTILRDRIYFTNFISENAPLITLSGPSIVQWYNFALMMHFILGIPEERC